MDLGRKLYKEERVNELVRPGDLKKATEEKEMGRARELLEAQKRHTDEKLQLEAAFKERQLQPDVKERLRRALTAAAERGETHLQVLTFPSELCVDGGRAINNGDPNWPET